MSDSVFTKMIKGEIPCHKVYEDEHTLAILDIHPVQPGMTLVIPKTPASNFFDLPLSDYQALWLTVAIVAKKLKQVFPEKRRIGIQVEGLDIDYVHVKLIPISSGEQFRAKPDFSLDANSEELAQLANKLKFEDNN